MSEQILQQILHKLEHIDTKFDQLDMRFERIESRLDQFETRFEKIESRLDQFETRFEKIESRLDHMDERLTSLEAGQQELYQISRAIQDRQVETDAKLEALTIDIHYFHGELKRLEHKVDHNHEEVKAKIGQLKTVIDFTYERTNKHELEIYKLNKAKSSI